jgi:hypothetical protein
MWDLAPAGGGLPGPFQATANRAGELIALDPDRYRLAIDGEAAPTERSESKAAIARRAKQ